MDAVELDLGAKPIAKLALKAGGSGRVGLARFGLVRSAAASWMRVGLVYGLSVGSARRQSAHHETWRARVAVQVAALLALLLVVRIVDRVDIVPILLHRQNAHSVPLRLPALRRTLRVRVKHADDQDLFLGVRWWWWLGKCMYA